MAQLHAGRPTEQNQQPIFLTLSHSALFYSTTMLHIIHPAMKTDKIKTKQPSVQHLWQDMSHVGTLLLLTLSDRAWY
jgi:hypothetical protein